MAVSASPPPSAGASLLVSGGAIALLGSAMVMAAYWPAYSAKDHRDWMKKWGRRFSFVGALLAVMGAADVMGAGEHLIVGIVLFLVVLAMGGLLVAALILHGPPSVEESEVEKSPSDEHQAGDDTAVAGEKGIGQEIHVEDATENGTEHRKPPEASEM